MRRVHLLSPLERLRLVLDDRGATMVEYSLVVFLIAMVAILAVTTFGQSVLALFEPAADAF